MTGANLNLRNLRVGVIRFPGSNCDVDAESSLRLCFNAKTVFLWHEDKTLSQVDAVVIPGGFSYGDYLRCGALAAHSPIMNEIKNFAARGGSIIGICNGFQILVEANLLPGVLLRNLNRKFICKTVNLKNPAVPHQKPLQIPVAHGEGRYFADEQTLSGLLSDQRIAYQYVDELGGETQQANPNGSLLNIAGVWSKNKKILGLMPHPERATAMLTGGSKDGLEIWKDFLRRV